VSDWVQISGSAGGDEEGYAVDRISLRAVVGTTDGGLLRATVTGDMDDAEKLGAGLAAELLDMAGTSLPGVRTAGSGVPR
jgi:hydroxymethylbilane synthase